MLTPTPLHGGLAAAELSPAVGLWPALSSPQTPSENADSTVLDLPGATVAHKD